MSFHLSLPPSISFFLLYLIPPFPLLSLSSFIVYTPPPPFPAPPFSFSLSRCFFLSLSFYLPSPNLILSLSLDIYLPFPPPLSSFFVSLMCPPQTRSFLLLSSIRLFLYFSPPSPLIPLQPSLSLAYCYRSLPDSGLFS